MVSYRLIAVFAFILFVAVAAQESDEEVKTELRLEEGLERKRLASKHRNSTSGLQNQPHICSHKGKKLKSCDLGRTGKNSTNKLKNKNRSRKPSRIPSGKRNKTKKRPQKKRVPVWKVPGGKNRPTKPINRRPNKPIQELPPTLVPLPAGAIDLDDLKLLVDNDDNEKSDDEKQVDNEDDKESKVENEDDEESKVENEDDEESDVKKQVDEE